MKLIGISARIMTVENSRKEFVNRTYLETFQKYGVNTILLTTGNSDLEAILDLCDGLVLTGGDDIDPKYFHEENQGLSKGVEPLVDELDQRIISYAVKNKKPLLGICRGMQAINVFSGGSIYQDIGTNHQRVTHEVTTYPNRFLNWEKTITVNSYHHQAVRRISEGYQVIAKHQDGTIEAIIHQDLPIIGVQWHPELISDSESSRLLFSAFFNLI
jgi:putative glutamine amidotransferase